LARTTGQKEYEQKRPDIMHVVFKKKCNLLIKIKNKNSNDNVIMPLLLARDGTMCALRRAGVLFKI